MTQRSDKAEFGCLSEAHTFSPSSPGWNAQRQGFINEPLLPGGIWSGSSDWELMRGVLTVRGAQSDHSTETVNLP